MNLRAIRSTVRTVPVDSRTYAAMPMDRSWVPAPAFYLTREGLTGMPRAVDARLIYSLIQCDVGVRGSLLGSCVPKGPRNLWDHGRRANWGQKE